MAKILIVDDHAINRECLATLLKHAGYDVVEAAGATQALAAARQRPPDLLITDVRMPDIDGYELYRRFKAVPALAGIPVMFHTAAFFLDELDKIGCEYGNAITLAKPSAPTAILAAVAQALGAAREGAGNPAHASLADGQARGLRLATLLELSLALAGERDPERLLRLSCRGARDILGAPHVAVALLDEGGYLRHLETTGFADDVRAALGSAPSDTRFLEPFHRPGATIRSAVIASPSRRYGWLYLAGPAGEAARAAESEQIIANLATQLALAWENLDAQRLVAQRERQLSQMIEAAVDAIITVDSAQCIHLVNSAAEAIFGYPRAQLLGQPLGRLIPYMAIPIDATHAGPAAGAQRKAGALATFTGVRADGTQFQFEAAISTSKESGIRLDTFVMRDITESLRMQAALLASERRERGRSEELSALLDAVPTAVCFAHDHHAGAITGNQLYHEWMASRAGGSTPPGVRLRKDGVDLAPAQMPLQLAATGIEVRDYECEFVYPDGSIRHVLGNATPLRDDENRPRGSIAAFIDITARQQAKLAMQVAKVDAERANNSKSRFLAAASHDLRQPLSAISVYADVLKSHVAGPGQALLANMKGCIGSMSELLAKLLDLSKLEAGVVKANCSDFLIEDTLAKLASIHTPEAQLKGLRLRLRCAGTSPIVHGDPILLQRILGNIVENAIRYTERGGVLVTCRRRHGMARLEVWDSGIGIPDDKTAEVFEEFKQLGDDARNQGSGLGLAIVARTAQLLGLKVGVRSRLGRGSVFTLELPLGRAELPPRAAPRIVGHSSLRIALVEDNASLRQALVYALEAAGHCVAAAACGDELRPALLSAAPDIVISDYRLAGGKTGFDVIAMARAIAGADLPVILITGDTDPMVMRAILNQGIIVLHKPLNMDTLLDHLASLTHKEALMST